MEMDPFENFNIRRLHIQSYFLLFGPLQVRTLPSQVKL